MLEAYKPKGVESLEARFVDQHAPPHWVGMGAWTGMPCFNTAEAKAKGDLPP